MGKITRAGLKRNRAPDRSWRKQNSFSNSTKVAMSRKGEKKNVSFISAISSTPMPPTPKRGLFAKSSVTVDDSLKIVVETENGEKQDLNGPKEKTKIEDKPETKDTESKWSIDNFVKARPKGSRKIRRRRRRILYTTDEGESDDSGSDDFMSDDANEYKRYGSNDDDASDEDEENELRRGKPT